MERSRRAAIFAQKSSYLSVGLVSKRVRSTACLAVGRKSVSTTRVSRRSVTLLDLISVGVGAQRAAPQSFPNGLPPAFVWLITRIQLLTPFS